MDETIETVRKTAEELINDLKDSDIDRDEAQRRKDEIIEEIDNIRATLTDSDGQIATIET